MRTERQIRRAIDRPGLDGLTALCRESIRIEKALHQAVANARERGHSWSEIGKAMGMTRQGAWRRFTKGPLAIQGSTPPQELEGPGGTK